MNDMISLAGVISELSSKEYFQSPLHTLRFLRVLNIIHEEALGLASAIENEQLVGSFGHESLKAAQRIRINLDTLRKIGAIEPYDNASDEEAYQLTAIGSLMFSDSVFRRTTEFDLSEETDHILISGPNGAGKFTITFCWDAVPYSGKVDLEGFSSQNLPPDQTWHATIELAFKNAGQVKWTRHNLSSSPCTSSSTAASRSKKVFFIHEGDEGD